MQLTITNRLCLKKVDIKIRDPHNPWNSSIVFLTNADIEVPSGAISEIDPYDFKQLVMSVLDQQTLNELADKIYKAKFESIINK